MFHKTTFLFSICLSFLSCSQTKQSGYQIELMNLGVPEYGALSNRSKIGAKAYFKWIEGEDSISVKLCVSKKLLMEGLLESDTLPFSYFSFPLDSIHKAGFTFIKDYTRGLPNGYLSKKVRDIPMVTTFGAWMVIVTDSTRQKHYYLFERPDLPDPIKDLCLELPPRPFNIKKFNTSQIFINTDSVVESAIKDGNLMLDSSIILSPPLRSIIKFDPPPYKNKHH